MCREILHEAREGIVTREGLTTAKQIQKRNRVERHLTNQKEWSDLTEHPGPLGETPQRTRLSSRAKLVPE